MGVLSKLQSFVQRHKNTFIIGGVLLTATGLLLHYGQQKLKDWQENEAKVFFERTRKYQHFENTERTCNQTIINLNKTLCESLDKKLNTEEIIKELRNNTDLPKVELWEELKILIFTKVSCLIYMSAMLVVLLRIQLNIVSGYLFKDSTSLTKDVQAKFLTICNQLIDTGMTDISSLLKEEYTKLLEPIPLKRLLKLSDLEKIFWTIQATIKESDVDPIKNFRKHVISDSLLQGNDTYTQMISDTADLLDSEEVKNITSSCINYGFSLVSDNMAKFYTPNGETSAENSLNIHTNRIAVAKLIPVINGLLSNQSLANGLVQYYINNDKIKLLGANIYEAFSCN